MEALPFIAVIIAVTILGASKWSLRVRARPRRALARAKTTPIGEVKDGDWAKVEGVVGAVGPEMTSPIGGHACIGYRLAVQRADHDYGHVLTREACAGFSLTDDTGRVDIEGPFQLALEPKNDWSMVRRQRFGALEEAGVQTQGASGDRQFAYREALLREGDRVSVLGIAFLEPDPTRAPSGFREPVLIRRMRGSNDTPIVVADAE